MLVPTQRGVIAEAERLFRAAAGYRPGARGPEFFDCIWFVYWCGRVGCGFEVTKAELAKHGADGPYPRVPNARDNLLLRVLNAFLVPIPLDRVAPAAVLSFVMSGETQHHMGLRGRAGQLYHCDGSLGVKHVTRIGGGWQPIEAWHFPAVAAQLKAQT